jgi:rod shape determining protein RodA
MRQNSTQKFFLDLLLDVKWSHVFIITCLMILSSLFIYSATFHPGEVELPSELKRQWLWFGLGWALYVLIALLDYHWLCRQSWFPYLGVVVMLVLVLAVGKSVYGSQRWLNVGFAKIQPSEFAKVTVMMSLCYYFSRNMGRISDWRRLGFAALITLIPGILIHKQPDLGTALVVLALFLVLLFLADLPMRFFVVLGVIASIIIAAVGFETYRYVQHRNKFAGDSVSARKNFKSFLHLKGYQLDRILGVVAPSQLDRLKEGWNREQSLTAIGSGGIHGKGWTKGDVTRGGYLPRTVSLNDFIFAVFAEETGLVGGIILAGLYGALFISGIRVALKARDTLGMLLASGVTFILFFHVFVNMGMTLGILPIVGVPLPLMSYGGSFVLVCMIALGLLQSVWLHRKPY